MSNLSNDLNGLDVPPHPATLSQDAYLSYLSQTNPDEARIHATVTAERIIVFRHRFHSRDDVYGRFWKNAIKGTKGYAPVCKNIWSDDCALKAKNGTRCDSCKIRKFAPFADPVIAKHISGDERIILYLLKADGTSHFAALDFDMKEGRESQGYTFDDVGKASDLLLKWGVPHGIARSTGNGFHLYIFFNGPIAASKSRALLNEVFVLVGFKDATRQEKRPLPEIFPKQKTVDKNGLGNGIRPPMVTTRFEIERNGWVDRNNQWIGSGLPWSEMVAVQWEYFKKIPAISEEEIDEIIKRENIVVDIDCKIPKLSTSATSSSQFFVKHRSENKKNETYDFSKFDNVVNGCIALRRVVESASKRQISHHEGFDLISIVSKFKGWRQWFKASVSGWDKTQQDSEQIDSFVAKYGPHTCSKLQEHGVCTFCDPSHCLPPLRDENDRYVSPSPIRFASQPTNWGELARALSQDDSDSGQVY